MADKKKHHLKEFVTIPVGKEEVEFMGATLYTTQTLKENVKTVAKKYMSTRASSIITQMIDNKKIFPVFKNKRVIDFLLKKGKLRRAYATEYKGKIYLFLDYLYSIIKLSSVNEQKLASILLHELIHVAESKKPKEFFQLNKKYFVTFFKEFFSYYLRVDKKDISDSIITELLERIIKFYNKTYINFRHLYLPLFKSLEKFTRFDEKTYKQEIWVEFLEFLDEQFSPPFAETIPGNIFDAGKEAYIKLTGRPTDTLGQEFWVLSEIISMVGTLKPDHPSIDRTIILLTK